MCISILIWTALVLILIQLGICIFVHNREQFLSKFTCKKRYKSNRLMYLFQFSILMFHRQKKKKKKMKPAVFAFSRSTSDFCQSNAMGGTSPGVFWRRLIFTSLSSWSVPPCNPSMLYKNLSLKSSQKSDRRGQSVRLALEHRSEEQMWMLLSECQQSIEVQSSREPSTAASRAEADPNAWSLLRTEAHFSRKSLRLSTEAGWRLEWREAAWHINSSWCCSRLPWRKWN